MIISIAIAAAGILLLATALLIAAVWGNGVARMGGDWREALIAAAVSGIAAGLLVAAGMAWGGV